MHAISDSRSKSDKEVHLFEPVLGKTGKRRFDYQTAVNRRAGPDIGILTSQGAAISLVTY